MDRLYMGLTSKPEPPDKYYVTGDAEIQNVKFIERHHVMLVDMCDENGTFTIVLIGEFAKKLNEHKDKLIGTQIKFDGICSASDMRTIDRCNKFQTVKKE